MEWSKRSIEIRNLYNPAFCGLLLLKAIEGFESKDKMGIPFSYLFLILPLCLFEQSRNLLIENKRKKLLRLLVDHPEILIEFPDKCIATRQYMLESMGLVMSYGLLSISQDGKFKKNKKPLLRKIEIDGEVETSKSAAEILGRMLAEVGSEVTVFSSLGVKP